MPPRTKNPSFRDFDPKWYLCKENAAKYPSLIGRHISTGRRVDIAPKYKPLVHHRLRELNWQNLLDLPHLVYPKLVRAFYANLSFFTRNADDEFEIRSYVKGKHITLTPSLLSQILGTPFNPQFVYLTTETELQDLMTAPPFYSSASVVFQTITSDGRSHSGNLKVKDLKPKLRALNRFLSENVVPKAGHFDAVTIKDAFLLYCFEITFQIDVNYIILNEMADASVVKKRCLPYGALLTKVFIQAHVDFNNEDCHALTSPITDYYIGRGGADVTEGQSSQQPHVDAPPPPVIPMSTDPAASSSHIPPPTSSSPTYITHDEFQQFTNRFYHFEEASLQFQNQMLQRFDDFNIRNDERITRVEDQVGQIYQHYYPPPPPQSD